MSDFTDEQLWEMIKNSDEAENLPIPQSWFKKFGIPPRNPVPVKEYIESNYAMKIAMTPKQLPPILIDEPQRNGALVEVPVEEPVPVDVIQRPFEWDNSKPFPATLPSLTDDTLLEQVGKASQRQSAQVVEQDEYPVENTTQEYKTE